MKNFKEMVKPFAVLVIICVIVGGLLALTDYVTAPIIEENNRAAAKKTRKELLPDAASYEELTVSDAHDVDGVYVGKDANGVPVGYIISVTRSGYKSVSVSVALGTGGEITGLAVDASSETKGIGSKIADADYIAEYIGISGSADDVDLIAQATYSSSAVRECVNAAFAVYEEIGGAEDEK